MPSRGVLQCEVKTAGKQKSSSETPPSSEVLQQREAEENVRNHPGRRRDPRGAGEPWDKQEGEAGGFPGAMESLRQAQGEGGDLMASEIGGNLVHAEPADSSELLLRNPLELMEGSSNSESHHLPTTVCSSKPPRCMGQARWCPYPPCEL